MPYTISPIIDPDPSNVLSCGPSGLYATGAGVTAGAQLLNIEATTTLPATGGAGVPSRTQYAYDTVLFATNMTAFTTGTGPSHAFAYLECDPGFDGIYAISISVSGWTAGPAAAGDVIFRVGFGLSIVGGAAGMTGVPVYTSAAAPYNTPAINASGVLPLAAGDQVWVEVAVEDYTGAFAGATLDYGPTYDNIATAGLSFGAVRIGETP